MKGQFKHGVLLDESERNKWPTELSFGILGTFTHTTFVFTLCYFLFIVDQQVLCTCLRKFPAELEPMIQVLKAGLVVKTLLVPGGSSTRETLCPTRSVLWILNFWNKLLYMIPRPASSSRDEKSPKGSLFTHDLTPVYLSSWLTRAIPLQHCLDSSPFRN